MPEPSPAMLTTALVAALVLAGVLGWLCYRLLVDRGRLLLRLEDAGRGEDADEASGLRGGSYLSDFALPALGGRGEMVSLAALAGQRLLVVFVAPDCVYCRAVARELAEIAPDAERPLPVLIVCGEGSEPGSFAPFAALWSPVLLDPGAQVARLMRVSAVPVGYLVNEERRTEGPLLVGPVSLLAAARGEAIPPLPAPPPAVTPLPTPAANLAPLPRGAPAPDFTLPLATGGEWTLAARRGVPLTLVFSDPGCPPCRALLAQLREWDRRGVVVVGRGDLGENREMLAAAGLTAPTPVQQNREVARLYGVLETPAAYAIAADGTIADGPAIGGAAVLALIARNGASGRPGAVDTPVADR